MILLKVVVTKYFLIPWKPIERLFRYLNISILALCVHVQLVSARTTNCPPPPATFGLKPMTIVVVEAMENTDQL
jgi:hypothetical protein